MGANKVVITIPGRMEALNNYINVERTNRYKGANIKRDQQSLVFFYCPDMDKPIPDAHISITYYEPDKRRDPDNVGFARKWILDGLVQGGVIATDGWKGLDMPAPFTEEFYVDRKNPRIEITVERRGG